MQVCANEAGSVELFRDLVDRPFYLGAHVHVQRLPALGTPPFMVEVQSFVIHDSPWRDCSRTRPRNEQQRTAAIIAKAVSGCDQIESVASLPGGRSR